MNFKTRFSSLTVDSFIATPFYCFYISNKFILKQNDQIADDSQYFREDLDAETIDNSERCISAYVENEMSTLRMKCDIDKLIFKSVRKPID